MFSLTAHLKYKTHLSYNRQCGIDYFYLALMKIQAEKETKRKKEIQW